MREGACDGLFLDHRGWSVCNPSILFRLESSTVLGSNPVCTNPARTAGISRGVPNDLDGSG